MYREKNCITSIQIRWFGAPRRQNDGFYCSYGEKLHHRYPIFWSNLENFRQFLFASRDISKPLPQINNKKRYLRAYIYTDNIWENGVRAKVFAHERGPKIQPPRRTAQGHVALPTGGRPMTLNDDGRQPDRGPQIIDTTAFAWLPTSEGKVLVKPALSFLVDTFTGVIVQASVDFGASRHGKN